GTAEGRQTRAGPAGPRYGLLIRRPQAQNPPGFRRGGFFTQWLKQVAALGCASILLRIVHRGQTNRPKRFFPMSRFVITVDFVLHPGALREFLPLMVENANKSRDV